jgi:hypothetical protein
VHGAVQAALSRSMAIVCFPTGEPHAPFRLCQPVSLRNCVLPAISSETITLAVSFVDLTLSLAQSSGASGGFWALAHDIKTELTAKMARGDHMDLMRSFQPPPPDQVLAFALEPHLHGRFGTIELSNRGVFHFPAHTGQLHLTRFFFSAASPYIGALIWVGAQTLNGELHLSFTVTQPFLTAEEGAKLVESTMRMLQQAATAALD